MYTKTDCLWGWCNVARKCQQQDFGHSIVFIVFHQSFTYILSTTSSSKPLVTWTNASVSLRRLAMLRLPVLCCHRLAYMERWTVRCLLLSCFLSFPFFLVPHPLAFCLSIPLFFSYLFILHALLNKNRTFLFNTMRLLDISANFAVDYQHH